MQENKGGAAGIGRNGGEGWGGGAGGTETALAMIHEKILSRYDKEDEDLLRNEGASE